MTAQDFVARKLMGKNAGISLELLPEVFNEFVKEIKDAEAAEANLFRLLTEQRKYVDPLVIPPVLDAAIEAVLNNGV